MDHSIRSRPAVAVAPAGQRAFSQMEVSQLGGLDGNFTPTSPGHWNLSLRGGFDLLGEAAMQDVSSGLRMFITCVYALVCAAGLLGNGLVMHLIWTQKTRPAPVINVFVFGLAVTDFQFSLTLPFWAVETALDFHWTFGQAMCKIVPSLTLLSVYTNVFLLTAMSVARYWSVASALKDGARVTPRLARWITVALWGLALGATIPTTLYTTVVDFAGVQLCLFRFPQPYLLGVYHLQRVVLTFAVPLAVISTSYLLLLRLLRTHQVSGNNPKRQSQVASTVRLVVASFFICWFPNHAITLWGVLVKFGAAQLTETFYFFQHYVFPLTTCLAHANSCLNPILYCLMRHEFREAMKDTCRRLSRMASFYRRSLTRRSREEVALVVSPCSSPSGIPSCPQSPEKEVSTLSSVLELRTKEPILEAKMVLIPGVEGPM
ncbi:hypothetical protein lerEdw1_010655 [Lerista edwardsae]|nr:hypothetical protein lerEdw1_010655 [Lerista edwardsae]